MIVKSGSKYKVKSHDGKKTLGTFNTHEAANKRLGQIEYFKHAKQTHSSTRKGY